jgi:hypothetical protein
MNRVDLLLVKSFISQLPDIDRIKVENYAADFRALLSSGGPLARIALALVGTEEQDKA